MKRHQINMNRFRQGGHYVRYTDGLETGFMCRDEAINLQRIFGGTLHYDGSWRNDLPKLPKRRINWTLVAIVIVFIAMLAGYCYWQDLLLTYD